MTKPSAGMSAFRVRAVVDGREYDVTANTADYINYERTAHQQHFPPMDKGGQITMAAFMAWSAARRLGLTEMKFSDWSTKIDDLDMEADPVDPTDPAPEAG